MITLNEILGVNQSFWKVSEMGWKIGRGKCILKSILINQFDLAFDHFDLSPLLNKNKIY